MKTQNKKNRIAKNIFLSLLIVLTINVFADNKNNSVDTTNKKKVTDTVFKNKESNTISSNFNWMKEEVEKELIVKDIAENYNAVETWNIEVCEPELNVEEYKPTEEIIPSWMIIETEPELKVTDLILE